MPATARELGVADPFDPRANIAGAVKYLQWLDDTYWHDTIPDPRERVKFILASYNVGAGHVMDAQRLAEAEGGDQTRWADVAYWLLQKSRSEVYSRPEVRHGYCRGLEPVQYVSRILERYAHYEQFVRDPAHRAPERARSAPMPAPRRVAFLTLDDPTGFVIDDALAVAPLAARGWAVELVPWRAAADWGAFAAVVIRSPWDYQDDPDAFLEVLAAIDASPAGC